MSNLSAGLAAFEAKNYVEAFELLKPLAEKGNAEAQCIIGSIYDLGLGRESNALEAVKWYKKSASQGYGVASNNLGTIYYSGREGIEMNRAKASEWYQKAPVARILA
ncbi:MAG: sel1 repeat family protein [Richelia sp. RM2_1_2]|nr:sel1 repeat family protein [Richelia sp. RM1_1_1]NJO63239.1 sel1 repeat family protein [Richelia sp. RM2_1_2]